MNIFKTREELRNYIEIKLSKNLSLGFVPTMGALHQGHISLVERSVSENDFTVVSIFVNPTQFNNPNDLKNYPRDIEKDVELLSKAGCNAVFVPSVEEMYPAKDNRVFNFGGIETCMEGEHRPGHFNGVAQVVSKLFEIVPANNAYFGLKDFQQLAIIKQLVKQLGLSINIVSCDTLREPDGLAMSSRNLLLSDEHRKEASIIRHTLLKAKEIVLQKGIAETQEIVSNIFNKTALFELEYFAIVDDTYLQPISTKKEIKHAIACIAVWAGKVRLIDNIQIN